MASTAAIKGALAGLLALAFIAWILSLIGLAGLQRSCYAMSTVASAPRLATGIETGGESLAANEALNVIRGFNSNLVCEDVYRYYWFMIAFELVTLIALSCLAAFGLLAASALSFMAWLTVLSALFLQGSDSFLAITDTQYGTSGWSYSWSRLTAAGWIITTFANLGLIFLLAWRPKKLRNAAPGGSIRY